MTTYVLRHHAHAVTNRDSARDLQKCEIATQGERGMMTGVPARQDDEDAPGFELKSGPPGSVRLA